MRDINRIDGLYEAFKNAHKQVADLRFGQLMSNFFGWCYQTGRCSDIFFPEDDKWEQWIKEYINDKKE